jgi:hypothetical protein
VIVDTFRGKVRIRKWPKKRSKNKPPHTAYMNAWFADAAQKIKRVPGQVVQASMNQAKGTGLYPRDIILSMMVNSPFSWSNPDGTVNRLQKLGIYPVAFQGTRLQLAAPLALAAGVTTVMTWPTPILETVPLYNPTLPKRLTIPDGVNIVQLVAGLAVGGATTQQLTLIIRKNGTINVAVAKSQGVATPACSVTCGPIPVITGDYFELLALASAANNVAIDITYLTCELLDAEIPGTP